ncbi:MAG: redoxin domain-containing protein, partial [Candidatus Poribacteria bacterium]|nr:redoxin domain-containing protein [Candidatus Poribacteria bacterium]
MMSFMSLYGTSEHSIGWLAILLDASIKSVIVLALAAGLNLGLKRSSAAFRHLLWLLAVMSCLCLPVISATLPSWRLPLGAQAVPSAKAVPGFEGNPSAQLSSTNRQAVTRHAQNPQIDVNHKAVGSPDTVHEAFATSASQASGWWNQSTLWTYVGIAWGTGMLVVLLPLLTGLIGIWRIARRSRRITDGSLLALARELAGQVGIKRGIRLLQGETDMPLTWGILRPRVLMPANAENWPTDQQRAVLLHEFSHIQRWDWLTQTIAQISCAIYWFNPLVWVADHRMRLERERACDDHVLTNGCRATDYASQLLEIARTSRPPAFAARAAVAMAQPSWIEKRLRVILATDRNRNPVTKAVVAVSVLAVACLVLLIGVMRPAEAVEEEELLQQIREAALWWPQPAELPPSDAEIDALMGQFAKRIKNGFKLSERFLDAYPESEERDEVWMYNVRFLLGLRKQEQANGEIEAFLKAFPESKHAPDVWSIKIELLEREGKFKEALAQIDKMDHTVPLPAVYKRKAQIYSHMEDSEKAAEYRLRAAESTLGKPAPDFTLKDINGESVSLADFRGKVVLLNFWATWSEPCMYGLPALKAIYERFKHNPDFALIGISWDFKDETVSKFTADNEMPWIHIRDSKDTRATFNVRAIPHFTVIGKSGLIHENSMSGGGGLDAVIASLLADAPGEPDQSNIAKLHELRGDLHEIRGEREQALTEYERALRLQPKNMGLVSAIRDWYERSAAEGHSQPEKALAFHDESLPKLVEANRYKTRASFGMGYTALKFAEFYDERGNAEKCWQAFQIVMENDQDEYLAKWVKGAAGIWSTIRGRPEFKAFTEDVFETEQDRRSDEAHRKLYAGSDERTEAEDSFLVVEADGEIFMGVVLSSTGHLLVLDRVADATDIRVKITGYFPARVVARDSEARLAILKIEGRDDLRPVVMGTVEDLKGYAPFDYRTEHGGKSKSFPMIVFVTARGFSIHD